MARLLPKDRKEQILIAAIEVAQESNYMRITRDQVANKANCAPALISNYFGTMPNFRRDLMRFAVRNEVLEIIAQGLVLGDAQAKKAPQELRDKALANVK